MATRCYAIVSRCHGEPVELCLLYPNLYGINVLGYEKTVSTRLNLMEMAFGAATADLKAGSGFYIIAFKFRR